jgi:cytochrome c553
MRTGRPARRIVRICRALLFCAGLSIFPAHCAGDPARGSAKAATCSECHGAAGKLPQPGVPILAGQNQEFLVLQLFYLREGLRDVPQMAGLFNGFTDRDLEDVAAYFGAQRIPKTDAARKPELQARGAELAKVLGCGSCHLADYRGQRHVPRIAGQREDYLVLALKSYRDNKRTGTDTSMNAAMYQASDADIAALAHYLAQQ